MLGSKSLLSLSASLSAAARRGASVAGGRRSFSYLPMSQKTIDVIKATTPVVAPHAKAITSAFYPTLFKNAPAALSFFNKTNQEGGMQAEALADAVVAYASNIENLAVLAPAVAKISQRHVALAVTPDLYQIVHDNLMLAIGEVLGDAVTPEIGEAWSNAVMALAEILISEEEKLYQAVEARKGGWRGFKPFVVAKKEQVAEDTVAFDFACEHEDGFEFSAGQYLSIRLPEASGIIAPRHYTVTSAPGGKTLQCTTRLVKGAGGKPDGAVSTFMHKELKEGDEVRLSAPCGVFTPSLFGNDPVTFVTAGIGITPAWGMLQAMDKGKVKAAFHVDRSQAHDGLSSRLAAAGVPVDTHYGRSATEVGKALHVFAAQHGNSTQYLLCGPRGFMSDANRILEDAGAKNIHYEVFGTGSPK